MFVHEICRFVNCRKLHISERVSAQGRLQRAAGACSPPQGCGSSGFRGGENSFRAVSSRGRTPVPPLLVRPDARGRLPTRLRPYILPEVSRGNPNKMMAKSAESNPLLLLQKYFVENKPPRVRSCPVCRRLITVELTGVIENRFVASLWREKPPLAAVGDWMIKPSVAFKCGRRAHCKGGGYLLSPESHTLLPSGVTVCSPCARVNCVLRDGF